jgi:hypothetical protein
MPSVFASVRRSSFRCCSTFIAIVSLLLALKIRSFAGYGYDHERRQWVTLSPDKVRPRSTPLVRLLLTSLLLSRPVARAVVRCERTTAEISSGKAYLLLADSSDLPWQRPNDNGASPSLAG